jgi:hypothetical protein
VPFVWKIIAVLGLAVVAIAQTLGDPQSSAPPGSIYGRVTDQSTDLPLAGVSVYTSYYFWRISAVTDGDGRYVLPRLGQGQYEVKATSGTVWVSDAVALRSGRDRAALDLRLPFGAISGTVLDYQRKPVPGVSVLLIQGQYLLGELRYTLAGVTTTGRNGQYLLKGVVPSRRYALLAKETASMLLAASRVPAAPESRRLIAAPTYYPSFPAIEAAPPILVSPGEALDGVDVRMGQSRSYCIEATLESAAGALSFQLFEEYPTDGFSTLQGPKLALITPRGRTGSDGKIRVCDLHPGTYRLTVLQDTPDSVALFGSMPVVIADRDRSDVHLRAGQAQALSGRVVWDGTPPTLPDRRNITIRLEPLNRGVFPGERLEARPGIPDSFVLSRVLLDDYAVMVSDVPATLYVKEISYAGRSVLREPLRLSSGSSNTELRVVIARDGGYIHAQVRDRSGKPVPEPFLFIFPASAASEPVLAASLVSGETDRLGRYYSRVLAPGRYLVLASTTALDGTADCIGKLLRARSSAKEVEVLPGGIAGVELLPVAIE